MNHIAKSTQDKLFDAINYAMMTVVLAAVAYPLYFILIASVSDPFSVNAGNVWLLPTDVTWEGYREILGDHRIWRGYSNTIVYTAVGTTINVALTITAGYVLSRKDLAGRDAIMMLIVFTMFFNGGLIPTYLIVRGLGMVNTIWALVIPNAVTVFHVIISRTFFQTTIPDDLLEAAMMDGCSNTKFFMHIAVPLSMPIIAVMALFNAVGHWNAFFPALIYLRDQELYPLQLVLRGILIANEVQATGGLAENAESLTEQMRVSQLIRYGVVIVASLPVLALYPFVQKYFVKGVMIGSIKG